MNFIRGIITAVTAVAGKVKRFTASGRSGETIEDREIFQHYGFSSRPKAGAECVIIREGNHFVLIASADRRYEIALEDGEVALFTHEGVKVHLKNGKKVEVSGADEINLGGDRAALRKFIDERLKTLFDAHTHSGVTTGSGVSGVPFTPLVLDSCATDTVRGK